jgi:hypothetical protein
MKYYFLLLILICSSLVCLTGCKKSAQFAPVPPATGVIFSPATPYQEVLFGNVATFNFKVKVSDPVTSLAIRFLLPGATDYVALPEYPDVASPAPISKLQPFEYAVPGATVATADNLVKIKFTATTAKGSYSNIYTVRALNIGLQRARLWSAASSSTYRFSTVDLIRAVGVPLSVSTPLTQDLIPVYLPVQNLITGAKLDAIAGFTSGNGTTFKVITAATYGAAQSTYGTAYAALPDTVKLSAINSINSTPLLTNTQYFLAKVNRNNVFTYVGFLIKKSPTITPAIYSSTVAVDPTLEYIEMEIKNK